MTPEESLALLTEASYIDPTLLPAHDDDRVAAAHTWAAAVGEIDYPTARQAMVAHYQTSTHRLTPADLTGANRVKTPTYLVPQDQRPTARVAVAATPEWDSPADPCPHCGHNWIHDTRRHSDTSPYCPDAPGRVR